MQEITVSKIELKPRILPERVKEAKDLTYKEL